MTTINSRPGQTLVTIARAAWDQLKSAGLNEAQVSRWFAVPLVSDVRWVAPPADRPRRGLGAAIALWVAGERLPRASLALLSDEQLLGLGQLGLLGRETRDGDQVWAQVRVLPAGGLLLASDRDGGSTAVGAPDLSAYNLHGSLPPSLHGKRTLDVGCGAGILALGCARVGADAVGGDVDARALAFAQLNAQLNGLSARFVEADLFAGLDGTYDFVTFNAPLLRAPMATGEGDAPPLYVQSPRGAELALAFAAELLAHRAPDGEALLHAQLTPALQAALTGLATRAAVLSLRFASAPDGTPHALTSIRRALPPERRELAVPLGPLCPHLRRELFDAYHAPRALGPDATPLPAPWLELRTTRQLGGSYRAIRFGAIAIDDEDVKLLERLTGAPRSALGALEAGEEDRLARLVELGLVIVR